MGSWNDYHLPTISYVIVTPFVMECLCHAFFVLSEIISNRHPHVPSNLLTVPSTAPSCVVQRVRKSIPFWVPTVDPRCRAFLSRVPEALVSVSIRCPRDWVLFHKTRWSWNKPSLPTESNRAVLDRTPLETTTTTKSRWTEREVERRIADGIHRSKHHLSKKQLIRNKNPHNINDHHKWH